MRAAAYAAAAAVRACSRTLTPATITDAELDLQRYKIVVQVVIGEKGREVMVGTTGAKKKAITGVRVASRCLWDTDTDNYASFSFTNVRDGGGGVSYALIHVCVPSQDSLWCVAMAFGCYTE